MATESEQNKETDEPSHVAATSADENSTDEPGDRDAGDDRRAQDDAAFEDETLVAEPAARKGPSLAAVAALLLAIAALALSGWQLQNKPEVDSGPDTSTVEALAVMQETVGAGEQTIGQLTSQLQPLQQAISAAQERVAELASESTAARSDIETLQRRMREQSDAVEALPGRVAGVERSVSALEGISSGARGDWLLAQAEYFLQVANAELELAGNPGIAEQALAMADERLLTIGDPGLTDVRRAVASELQSLKSLDTPDIASTAVRLASLAGVVDALPVRRELLTKRPDEDDRQGDDSSGSVAPVTTATDEMSGRERAMATLKSAFSGFVSVRRTDEEAQPLMAPEAAYFLRVNLGLQLQSARLALLSGEQALLEQSLDDAADWLRDYYDTESAPVRNALTTIAEVRETTVAVELPDISESLRLLRRRIARASTEPAQ